MPWWSWILIWVALIALSLLYIVLLGIKLWRHLVRLGKEFSEASQRLSEHSRTTLVEGSVTDEGVTGHEFSASRSGQQLSLEHLESANADQVDPKKSGEFDFALFEDPEAAREKYRNGKSMRQAARRRRRVARRAANGQAQSLADLRAEGVDLYP